MLVLCFSQLFMLRSHISFFKGSKFIFLATYRCRTIEWSPESKHLFALISFFFSQSYLIASFTNLIFLPLKAGYWSYYAMFSCRQNKDALFHCDVCNVCFNKYSQGKHKCRGDSGHDECGVCLEVSW